MNRRREYEWRDRMQVNTNEDEIEMMRRCKEENHEKTQEVAWKWKEDKTANCDGADGWNKDE